MNKGLTVIELVITFVLLAVVGTFTFSVIWQYSKIHGDTRGGYVYDEGAALLERITRELRDAADVYAAPFTTSNPALYINFLLTHGTPADAGPPFSLTPPYWVQYCTCYGTGTSRAYLYRVIINAKTDGDQCAYGCPDSASKPAVLMSSNIMSSHSNRVAETRQGFQVKYIAGDAGNVEDDSYEITLLLAADRAQNNLMDDPVYPRNGNWNDLAGVRFTDNINTRLKTNICPRNYDSNALTSKSFKRNYYDQIK